MQSVRDLEIAPASAQQASTSPLLLLALAQDDEGASASPIGWLLLMGDWGRLAVTKQTPAKHFDGAR
jgi:hypothetical protein